MDQPITNIIAGLHIPLNYESITVADSSIGFTSTLLEKNSSGIRPIRAFCTCETAQIRFRYDGGAPTSSEGHILSSGDTLTVLGYDQLKNFRAIRTTGVSGVLKVTYEG